MRSISIEHSQNPQQKVSFFLFLFPFLFHLSFFHVFLSLIVSSRRHGLQMANDADEVLLGKRPR